MNRLLSIVLIALILTSCNKSKELVDNLTLIKGNELFAEGKYEEAKRIYLKGIDSNVKIDSTTLQGMYLLIGIAYEKQDSLKMAETYYLKSKAIDHNFWDAWVHLAIYYDNSNDFEQAKECYDKAVELKPKNTMILNNSALFHFNSGYTDDALNLINRSLEIDSLNETSIQIKAKILNRK